MSRPTPPKSTLFLSAAICLCFAAAGAETCLAKTPGRTPSQKPAQRSCAATTDAEIVAAIHEKIKADPRYDDQWSHINVSSRRRVVTINGWVKGSVQARDLVRYARTTRCVRRVVSRDLRTSLSTAGCLPGQIQCGDICIDKGQDCNIITRR